MKQLVLVYQEPCTEPSIMHIQTHKTSSHKLSVLGRQRISALILLAISIIIPVFTYDLTASFFLLPLSIALLFSKKIHIKSITSHAKAWRLV